MKKMFFCALLGALLSLAASCDKIDPDHYTIPSGVTGEWYASHENIPKVQRAMIEKYTGVRCVNCPDADEVIHASLEHYGDRLVAVAIHSGNFGRPLGSDPDLRTPGGTQWYETLVGTSEGLPAAFVNRGAIFNPISGVNDKVDPVLAQSPVVSMLLNKSNDEVSIHIGFEQTVEQELTLTILVTEDSILTTQMHGSADIHDYAQNHVLRSISTDIWGLPINVEKKQGSKYFITLPALVPEGCNLNHCHLVAFISEKESRKIINVAQCDF